MGVDSLHNIVCFLRVSLSDHYGHGSYAHDGVEHELMRRRPAVSRERMTYGLRLRHSTPIRIIGESGMGNPGEVLAHLGYGRKQQQQKIFPVKKV